MWFPMHEQNRHAKTYSRSLQEQYEDKDLYTLKFVEDGKRPAIGSKVSNFTTN